jgi:hypothetical protein
MTKEVYRWLTLVSVLSPLIPLICIYIYKKGQPRQNLILSVSFLISLAFDVFGWIMMYYHRSTNPAINLYIIVAFPAIMAFYHEILIKRSGKITVRVFTVVFLVSAIIFAAEQGLNVANHNTWMLSSILITITSLLFVVDLRLMDDSNFAKNHFHTTNIIINSSLAFYYFFTIILFAITDYVFSHFTPEDSRYFWIFHDAIYVLKNFGITVAFYLSAKSVLEFKGQSSKQAG